MPSSCLRRSIPSSETSMSQLPAFRSMRTVSPVRSQARPPPAALSGAAARLEALPAAPAGRPPGRAAARGALGSGVQDGGAVRGARLPAVADGGEGVDPALQERVRRL